MDYLAGVPLWLRKPPYPWQHRPCAGRLLGWISKRCHSPGKISRVSECSFIFNTKAFGFESFINFSSKDLHINNVLLVKIEGPVWHTIYHHLPIVKGAYYTPLLVNQPMGKGHLCSIYFLLTLGIWPVSKLQLSRAPVPRRCHSWALPAGLKPLRMGLNWCRSNIQYLWEIWIQMMIIHSSIAASM